jgi:hypothetical protein
MKQAAMTKTSARNKTEVLGTILQNVRSTRQQGRRGQEEQARTVDFPVAGQSISLESLSHSGS